MLEKLDRIPFQRVYAVVAACSLLVLFFTMRVAVIRNQEAETSLGINRAAHFLSASLSGDHWSGSIDKQGRSALQRLVETDSRITAIFVVGRTEYPTTLEFLVDTRQSEDLQGTGVHIDVQFIPGASEVLGIGKSLMPTSTALGLYPIVDRFGDVVGLVGVETTLASVISLKGSLTAGLVTLLAWMFLVLFGYLVSAKDRTNLTALLRLKSGKQTDAESSAVQLQRRVTQLAQAAVERRFVHREAFVGHPSSVLMNLDKQSEQRNGLGKAVVLMVQVDGIVVSASGLSERVALDVQYAILEVIGEVITTHGGQLVNYWQGCATIVFLADDGKAPYAGAIRTFDRLHNRLSVVLEDRLKQGTSSGASPLVARFTLDVGNVLTVPRAGRIWSGPMVCGTAVDGAIALLSVPCPEGVDTLMTERAVRRFALQRAVVDLGRFDIAGESIRVFGG